jgi:hypothetical protein
VEVSGERKDAWTLFWRLQCVIEAFIVIVDAPLRAQLHGWMVLKRSEPQLNEAGMISNLGLSSKYHDSLGTKTG